MINKAGRAESGERNDDSESQTWQELKRSTPRVGALSNGALTSVISSSGSTRLTFDGISVNRWSPGQDATYSIMIRDLDSGKCWSAIPENGSNNDGRVHFDQGRVRFESRSEDIEAWLDVFVSAADNSEIRRLILRNTSERRRRLDVTSYLEIVLNDAVADASHPAFSKLFIQTSLDGTGVIRAWRRMRSPDERPIFFAHLMTGDGRFAGGEAARQEFIGRGHTRRAPRAMEPGVDLGGHAESVLDPVAALRREVDLEPGAEAQVILVLGVAKDDAALERTVGRVTSPDFDVSADMRAAGAQEVERLLMLDVDARRARYIQRMTGALFYRVDAVRAPAEMIRRVGAPLARLSEYGLDPWRPIIVVRSSDERDATLIPGILKAWRYWAAVGLRIDVVIFNDQSKPEAADELHAVITKAITRAEAGSGVRGSIQTLFSEDIPPDDQVLIQCCASIIVTDHLPSFRAVDDGASDTSSRIARPAASANTLPSAPRPNLLFDNGYGGFTEDGREYAVIVDVDEHGRHRLPPQPWTNVIANEKLGFFVSETGAGTTWGENSREYRITPWSNDPVLDPHAEAFYIRDEDDAWYWSPMPGPAPAPASYHVYHGAGYTRFETSFGGLRQSVRQSVHREHPVKLTRVRIANETDRTRTLSVFAYQELLLGGDASTRHRLTSIEWDRRAQCLIARNPSSGEFGETLVFSAVRSAGGDISHATHRARFMGDGGPARPRSLEQDRDLSTEAGEVSGDAAALQVRIEVPAHEEVSIDFLLGSAPDIGAVRSLLKDLNDASARDGAVNETADFWDDLTGRIQISTPSAPIDLMVNRWLPYQNLSCRMNGRSAFYQSGGAYGYRDQLQDAAALVYLDPQITRRQILRHAAHQFLEGDVMHWWHPPTSKGIRTRFSDDLLWLPFVTSYYVRTTGDRSILDEDVPFLAARQLQPGEDEAFLFPDVSDESGSLYEHSCRAIDRSLTSGAHGLPLMGTGDWNDGMNRVGREGRGESVWLGFFLYQILGHFIPICADRDDVERAESYRAYRAHLDIVLNDVGWDGGWYRRAFYDNGDVIGSSQSDEARIDALAQAWAVISGVAPPDRAALALDAMEEHLVDEEAGIIRLLAPAFDRTNNDPGYIKGYVPGVRENGGQYTHAALWAVQALAEAGRGERAAHLLEMLSPISHTRTARSADRYRVEPYVIAADVYGVEPHVGRGGWTWYTGSAGWMYRCAIESIIGFSVEAGVEIILNPSVPPDWTDFSLSYTLPGDETTYRIRVSNPDGRTSGVRRGRIDGRDVDVQNGTLRFLIECDGKTHEVDVEM